MTEKDGNKCISKCESLGLFPDPNGKLCVGCHPACKNCFGPTNEECFECADGYLQVSQYNCDA